MCCQDLLLMLHGLNFYESVVLFIQFTFQCSAVFSQICFPFHGQWKEFAWLQNVDRCTHTHTQIVRREQTVTCPWCKERFRSTKFSRMHARLSLLFCTEKPPENSGRYHSYSSHSKFNALPGSFHWQRNCRVCDKMAPFLHFRPETRRTWWISSGLVQLWLCELSSLWQS